MCRLTFKTRLSHFTLSVEKVSTEKINKNSPIIRIYVSPYIKVTSIYDGRFFLNIVRQTDRMKLALSTLVVVVLAAILDTSSSSPIVGPFRDLQLPQLRIPSLDNVISAPGRAIDSGMRRMRQQTENFQRAMGRAGDRFQRGLVNLRPENFMNAIDNMIPDLIPGVPVIG